MFDNSESRRLRAAAVLEQTQRRLGVGAALGPGLAPGVYQVDTKQDWVTGLRESFQQRTPWIAAVDVQNIGWEAIANAGVELEKVVVVHCKKEQQAAVVPLIVDAFEVVILGASFDYKTQRTLLLRSRNSGAVVFATRQWEIRGIEHFSRRFGSNQASSYWKKRAR